MFKSHLIESQTFYEAIILLLHDLLWITSIIERKKKIPLIEN